MLTARIAKTEDKACTLTNKTKLKQRRADRRTKSCMCPRPLTHSLSKSSTVVNCARMPKICASHFDLDVTNFANHETS